MSLWIRIPRPEATTLLDIALKVKRNCSYCLPVSNVHFSLSRRILNGKCSYGLPDCLEMQSERYCQVSSCCLKALRCKAEV